MPTRSLVTVLIEQSASREAARRLLPSTSRPRICARFAVCSLDYYDERLRLPRGGSPASEP